MGRARAVTTFAALMLAWLPRAGGAQQVRGVIRDSATALVIPGAIASVFDSAGKPLARTIADQLGRYRLPAVASPVRLQILRIGYRPRDVALPPVRGDTTLTIDVSMLPVPKYLSAVHVSDRAICPERETGGEALALWEQARTGLLAMVVARTARPARVRNIVYERSIDVRSGKITSQTFERNGGSSNRPFVASRPAAEFARSGYMIEDSGGRTYFAPDGDVLLDPSFMTAHCFRIETDERTHPADVGLAFVPAPGRDTLVDVAGTLWLDRATLALRTMEYRYTGLEPAVAATRTGGSLLFRMMPNGVVFIERWSIVMPALGRIPGSTGIGQPARLRRDRRDYVVAGLHESGGELAVAVWPDAQWKASLAGVSGRVLERGTRRPVPDVRVWIPGTPDVVQTDSTGAFAFDELLPGPYVLNAADTLLAEFEFAQSRTRAVELERERPLALTLEWQPLDDVVRRLCEHERGPSGAVIFGRTTTADGTPVSDVALSAAWQSDFAVRADGALEFRRVSRSDHSTEKGVFYFCKVPREQRIGVRAQFAPRVVKDTAIYLSRDDMIAILRMTKP